MLSRRLFLQSGMATLASAGLGARLAFATPVAHSETLFLSAVDDNAGNHFIAGINLAGEHRFQLPVADRCHGGCARPDSPDAVLFARRPGRHLYVVDTVAGKTVKQVQAGDGYHFYGHGVFSPDSRYLYVTVNHYTRGDGIIRVYDADNDYAEVNDFLVGGIGPHELRLHPDGETLIIALGGIETHPDYDRIKLNPDTMEPALLLMNRRTGAIQERYKPSHHQLSCRHLDVSPEGIIIVGYQYQGPEWESHPLIARLDSRTGAFSEIALPDTLQKSLHNYTASVAVSPLGNHTAITAPRGNRVIVIDHHAGELVGHVDIADVAGALPLSDGGFVVSSGSGSVHRILPQSAQAEPIAQLDVHWDNHLTLHGQGA